MGVTAFPHPVTDPDYRYGEVETSILKQDSTDWMGITVGCTFLVGSLLLLSGKKRAGLVVTSAAAALTVLDQQDTVREWWNALPHHLGHAQRLLDQVQGTIDDLEAKRQKLRTMFNR